MKPQIEYQKLIDAVIKKLYEPAFSHAEMDVMMYGDCYHRMEADGTLVRIDPKDIYIMPSDIPEHTLYDADDRNIPAGYILQSRRVGGKVDFYWTHQDDLHRMGDPQAEEIS